MIPLLHKFKSLIDQHSYSRSLVQVSKAQNTNEQKFLTTEQLTYFEKKFRHDFSKFNQTHQMTLAKNNFDELNWVFLSNSAQILLYILFKSSQYEKCIELADLLMELESLTNKSLKKINAINKLNSTPSAKKIAGISGLSLAKHSANLRMALIEFEKTGNVDYVMMQEIKSQLYSSPSQSSSIMTSMAFEKEILNYLLGNTEQKTISAQDLPFVIATNQGIINTKFWNALSISEPSVPAKINNFNKLQR